MKFIQTSIIFISLLSSLSFANRVGSIAPEDRQKVHDRIESRSFNTFGLGPAYLSEANENNVAYHFTYGRSWEVHPHGGIYIRGDLISHFQDPLFMLTTAVGMNFFITTSDISPFVSADFGFGADTEKNYGFQIGFGGGVTFFRTSSTQFFLKPNMQVILTKGMPWSGGMLVGVHY